MTTTTATPTAPTATLDEIAAAHTTMQNHLPRGRSCTCGGTAPCDLRTAARTVLITAGRLVPDRRRP